MTFILELFKSLFANLRAGFDFVRGLYWLSRLETPIITIFAGHHRGFDVRFTTHAQNAAYQCVINGFSVLSGGGPGMMQAANCGAYEAAQAKKDTKLRTFGIGVRGVDEDFVNNCAEVVRVDSFYVRKWLLTHYSVGFVVFPGGIGTADELFTTLNSLKLKRMPLRPIILFGSEYWKPLLDWIKQSGIHEGFIEKDHLEWLHVTDDAQEIIRIINASLKRNSVS